MLALSNAALPALRQAQDSGSKVLSILSVFRFSLCERKTKYERKSTAFSLLYSFGCRILSDVLGWSIVSWPLVYVFPPFAPLLWIGIVVVLSASASYLPARHAARINVRNALEHE